MHLNANARAMNGPQRSCAFDLLLSEFRYHGQDLDSSLFTGTVEGDSMHLDARTTASALALDLRTDLRWPAGSDTITGTLGLDVDSLRTHALGLYPHPLGVRGRSDGSGTFSTDGFVHFRVDGDGVVLSNPDRTFAFEEFSGAEILSVDLNGRFETQVAGAQKGTNAYEIGVKIGLSIPRIVPFRCLRSMRNTAPRTLADIGYGLFRRVGLYGLESFNTSFGYVWRPNSRVWHDARPLDVSYNSLYYSSDAFNAFLDTNQVVKRSFEEQFIVGLGYTLTVSTRPRDRTGGYLLASIGFDESGNLLSAVQRINGPRPMEGDQLFGSRYSQYLRFRPELRYYGRTLRAGGRLVARAVAGSALPYGNSDVVPYVKQFFVGGTNSLRAFRARSVGPGTYVPEGNSGVLIDQTGDVRLEANLEYRFPISGYFKGAVFADAGNIWLVNDDPQRPGGKFEWSKVLPELAAGAGVGLRFDPEVIVVRLDLATPLRRPLPAPEDRWVVKDLRPRIFDNVVFNIAIGYPF